MDKGLEYQKRIAAIHGLDGQEADNQDPVDVRHAEFQAMADVFLGEDYDQAKLREVEGLQIIVHEKQAELYKNYIAQEIGPEAYVDSLNGLVDTMFTEMEGILGQDDFEALFCMRRSQMQKMVNKKRFLGDHRKGIHKLP